MSALLQPVFPPDSLVTRTADTVDAEAIDWLWEGFIARSFLNLLVGETAAGKSTMLADIVARLTRGRALPGEPGEDSDEPVRAPGRVLWLGSEDPMELLTVPRLMACRADRSMVTEIQGVIRLGTHTSFSLQDDLNLVGNKLVQGINEGRPYVAFVIDPITSYLQGTRVVRKVDMNDSGQLRSVLEPWLPLTKYANCAMIGVTHLAKDTTRSMLHRVLGGGAFAQLCRSLPAVVNLPDEGPFEKALLQVKTNLPGVMQGAWRFRTNTMQVAVDKRNGRPVIASFPEWDCIDPAITPHSMAGGTRGPVPQRRPDVFAPWLAALFSTAPTSDSELPVGWVRQEAIAAGVVGRSQNAWDEAAGRHLMRRNHGGTWLCRPKAP